MFKYTQHVLAMALFVVLVAPVRNRISQLLCGPCLRLIILSALPPLLKYLIELRVIVLVPRLHDGIAQYASPQAVALLTPDRNAFYVERRCIRRAGEMLSGEQLVVRSHVRLVTFRRSAPLRRTPATAVRFSDRSATDRPDRRPSSAAGKN
ncbi:hypothetical protein [Paraburkholderia youngii]|uniref:hypothetical protein n=1 Tax=Paraburkholderia youngii TaxID=2782701 RepID=UPI003D21EB4B